MRVYVGMFFMWFNFLTLLPSTFIHIYVYGGKNEKRWGAHMRSLFMLL